MGNNYTNMSNKDLKAKRAQRRQRNAASWVVGVLAALVLVVYAGGVVFFSFFFMPQTTVNGEDVSLKKASDVAAEVFAAGAEYKATVKGDGIQTTITGGDIGLTYDGDMFVEVALSQLQKLLWPYEVTQPHELTLSKPVTFDSAKLTSLTEAACAAVNKDATPPTNATVVFDSDTGKYKIAEEKLGTAVDKNAVYSVVAAGVSDMQKTIKLDKGQLEQPTVKKDDERLEAARAAANDLVKNTIDLTVDDKRVFAVESDLVSQWVHISGTAEVTLDERAVQTWAQGPLSKKFDTMGATRTFERKDGKKVTVSGGSYGWIINGAELASKLCAQVKSGVADPIAIPMKTRGEKWAPGGADWTRYVDVDLTEQHVRFYDAKGKVIWESDCVSGDVEEGRETPQGVYTLILKDQNRTLIGADEDKDGKPDYKSKVTYWMPFLGEDIGLHDASWRKSFGGDIYQSDGSHGCVNLPKKKAKKLYELIEPGDVICVHA